MKKHYFLALIALLCLVPFVAFSQDWPKTYGGNKNVWAMGLAEHYDHGYLLCGEKSKDFWTTKYGWLLKTDVNGNERWQKLFWSDQNSVIFFGLAPTPDGGMVLSGSIRKDDPYSDPLVVKLNACGEVEWCKIYSTTGKSWSDWAERIIPLNDGYIVYFLQYGYDLDKKMWLVRLDEQGEFIWQNYYGQSDTATSNEDSYDLKLMPDSGYLMTGFNYRPDIDSTQWAWSRWFLVRVNKEGDSQWELTWGLDSLFSGEAKCSVIDKRGDIYTTGDRNRRTPGNYGRSSTLAKTKGSGLELWAHNYYDNTYGSISNSLTWLADSTLAVSCSWLFGSSQPCFTGLYKMDTLGNMLKNISFSDECTSPRTSITSSDNKVIAIAGFDLHSTYGSVLLWKVNSDLEYDTLYARPFTYDSLCPHAIASDTINLDCDIVVDVDEPLKHPERSQLKAYPNPATGQITVELPKYLMSEETHGSLTAGHIVHQWRQGAVLEAYDSNGVRVLQTSIPSESATMTLDVSQWAGGMYFIRLVRNGKMVGNVKVVVSD